MADSPETERATVFRDWSETVKSILEFQWQMFDGSYSVGQRMMERALSPPPVLPGLSGRPAEPGDPGDRAEEGGGPAPTLGEKVRQLERLGAERVKQGLPPPRELYRTPYRDLIDWAAFPDWARPIDPDLFENAGHEG